MWFKKKKSSEKTPEKEVEEYFEAVDWWRRVALISHQIVFLRGNETSTPGWSPSKEQMPEFKSLVLKTLSQPCPPRTEFHSVEWIGEFKGFFLTDPLLDRPELKLEDIPAFSSPREITNFYYLRDGVLLEENTNISYAAQELEDWLKEKWFEAKGTINPQF